MPGTVFKHDLPHSGRQARRHEPDRPAQMVTHNLSSRSRGIIYGMEQMVCHQHQSRVPRRLYLFEIIDESYRDVCMASLYGALRFDLRDGRFQASSMKDVLKSLYISDCWTIYQ